VASLTQAQTLGADAQSSFLLGYIFVLDGDDAAGRAQAQRLLASASARDQAWGATLRGLAAYVENDSPGALADLDRAVKLDPANLFAQVSYAKVELAAQQVEAARERTRLVLRGYPDSIVALDLMGMTYQGQGRWQEARSWFERGLAAGAMREVFLYNVGATYVGAGEFAQAETSYREAIAVSPDFVPAHLNLAVALKIDGDWKAAADQYAQVLDLDPGNDQALEQIVALWQEHDSAQLASEYSVHYAQLAEPPS
jgi:tetratricopeptide (TPR) repeat protein